MFSIKQRGPSVAGATTLAQRSRRRCDAGHRRHPNRTFGDGHHNEGEIARQGGGRVTIYADQFAVVGSIKVVLPGLSELHALGLIDVKRHTQRHVCALSDRWRGIETAMHAMRISANARVRRSLPVTTPTQPASVSA